MKKNNNLSGDLLKKLKKDKELVSAIKILCLKEFKMASGFETKLIDCFWCADIEAFEQLGIAFPKIAQAISLCQEYGTMNIFSAFGINFEEHRPKYCDISYFL
jgi:hypothetical protein